MSVESDGVGRDLRTSLLCGLEEVQAEVRQLRMVVDTSMESIAHQLLAQSTKEVSLIYRCFIYLTDFECWCSYRSRRIIVSDILILQNSCLLETLNRKIYSTEQKLNKEAIVKIIAY